MTEFESVMMHRDGMDEDEARQCRAEASEAVNNILENGGDYDEVEDMLMNFYGLEMDYIFDLI